MDFYVNPSSNVALPLFQPSSDSQSITVERETGQLAIITYVDDSTSPPVIDQSKVLKNWYICRTYFGGYRSQTLNWVLGNEEAEPQNPTCIKVEVEREFVS